MSKYLKDLIKEYKEICKDWYISLKEYYGGDFLFFLMILMLIFFVLRCVELFIF